MSERKVLVQAKVSQQVRIAISRDSAEQRPEAVPLMAFARVSRVRTYGTD